MDDSATSPSVDPRTGVAVGGEPATPDAIRAALCADGVAVLDSVDEGTAAIEGAAMTPPVRVSSLQPGAMWRPMVTGLRGDDQAPPDAVSADTPRKIIRPRRSLADAILLGNEAARVTGIEPTVGGGRGAD